MAHDEFNNGARHGFNRALFAVRNVDREIELPEKYNKEQEAIYQAQKDILYKIYEEINFEKAKEVHKNDY